MKALELSGERFGKLVVLRRVENSKNHTTMWACRCDCGNERTVLGIRLTYGNSKSCGCSRRRGLRAYEHAYNKLKTGRVKHIVELTYAQFVSFSKTRSCHYCTAPIVWNEHHDGRSHLDRVDSAQGYSVLNCVVCCARCNWGKGKHFTYEEWWDMTEVFRRRTCKSRHKHSNPFPKLN